MHGVDVGRDRCPRRHAHSPRQRRESWTQNCAIPQYADPGSSKPWTAHAYCPFDAYCPTTGVHVGIMTYHEFHELMMPSVSQRLTNDLDGVVSAFHNNREQTPFQKLVRRIVAENAPPTKEIERIKKAFHRLDKNKSQTLTREELSLGVRQAGYVVSDDDLDRVFKELDTDGTGLVRYHEFVAGAIDHNILVGENLLRWVFDFMDDDDSNTITGDNLRVRAVCC